MTNATKWGAVEGTVRWMQPKAGLAMRQNKLAKTLITTTQLDLSTAVLE
jgi:hypothetical protein